MPAGTAGAVCIACRQARQGGNVWLWAPRSSTHGRDPPPPTATGPPTHLHRALLVQAALLHALLQRQHLFALYFLLLVSLQWLRR